MATPKKGNTKKVQDDIITSPGGDNGPIEVMSGDEILAQPDDRDFGNKGLWNPQGEELKLWAQFKLRKQALLQSRYNVYGLNIDAEMRRFDKKYFRRQADIPASELDANQRPLAINQAFGKVQTALGILIDADPNYIMESDNPKYDKTKYFLKALAEKSWRNTNSLGQFKLSVFNSARRGWFIGRTFNRRLYHDARYLTSVSKTGKRAYETRLVTKMDDIAYMNLSNYNAWLDEQTRPEDFFSTRDWMWREVWYIDDLKRTFPVDQFPNMKFVKAGGDTRENIQGVFSRNSANNKTGISPLASKKGMTEVFLYENQYSDQFIIEANDTMIVAEPLPQNNKRLSCSYGQWHFRGDDTIYGMGIIEEMENNEELADRIINMDMRQLLATIAPMGFYSGTEDFEDENIRVTPGVLRRTMNPKDINFLQIPQGNNAGLDKVAWLSDKQNQTTGITPIIEGTVPDQNGQVTAFQVGVNRESALKRLSLPLKSLQYALKNEFENRVALIQQTYSDFEVEHLENDQDIFDYLDEVNKDPDFFFIENKDTPEEKFFAIKYRMANLNVEKGEDGSYIESENSTFFAIKPEMLAFSGFTSVDETSLLTGSKALDQADTLRMVNLLVPMLSGPMEANAKPAKQLITAFDRQPKDWLPQPWLDFLNGVNPQQAQGQGAVIQANANAPQGASGGAPAQPPQAPQAQTVIPQQQMENGNSAAATAVGQ
jgi:hypothetical protein